MVANPATTVTFVKKAKSLFRHKVGDRVGSTDKKRFDVTALGVMSAEMAPHVDVTSSGFIRRV